MNEQKFGRHSFVSYGRFLYLFIDFVEYLRGFVIVVVDVFKQFPGKASIVLEMIQLNAGKRIPV